MERASASVSSRRSWKRTRGPSPLQMRLHTEPNSSSVCRPHITRNIMSSRILLVEDEPGLVVTLTDLLRAEGYEIETAAEGPTGLALASEGSFDLILLDVMLPGKNGLDVCRDLRQRGIDTPILMLTAKTQLVDRVVG